MHPIVKLLLIVGVALIGYFVPKKYNEYFYREYHEKAVSIPFAIATAIVSFLWLLFMDLSGFWYWSLLIVSILLCIASVVYVIYIGMQVRAGIFEIIFAIFAQLLATVGAVIIIMSIVFAFTELFGGKKKKRR